MSGCYYHKHYTLPKGNYDTSIDCTYVLLMVGSDREEQILEQIKNAEITTDVILQYNHGYKKCDKNLRVNKPNYDLEHACKTIFKHALNSGFKRIIVLEDDCEFDERIRDEKVIKDINTFLNRKNPDIYNLGTTLSLSSPIDILLHENHHLLLYNTCSHATIYSEKYMKHGLTHNFLLGHSDFETNRHMSKYTYKFPIAYQKIVETENAKEGWGYTWPVLNTLMVSPLRLHEKVQPGFDRLKMIFDYVSVLLCLLLIYYIIKKKTRL